MCVCVLHRGGGGDLVFFSFTSPCYHLLHFNWFGNLMERLAHRQHLGRIMVSLQMTGASPAPVIRVNVALHRFKSIFVGHFVPTCIRQLVGKNRFEFYELRVCLCLWVAAGISPLQPSIYSAIMF